VENIVLEWKKKFMNVLGGERKHSIDQANIKTSDVFMLILVFHTTTLKLFQTTNTTSCFIVTTKFTPIYTKCNYLEELLNL